MEYKQTKQLIILASQKLRIKSAQLLPVITIFKEEWLAQFPVK